MRNNYEFDIKDINKIVAIDNNSVCNYKTEYVRIDAGDFIETCHSDPIIELNKVNIVCERCGAWTSYTLDEFNSKDFNPVCSKCKSDYESIYSEDEIIEIIMSFMDKEVFNGITLLINDIEIA